MTKREPHPSFAAVLDRCRAQPGAAEERLFGETVFRVHGRAFAFLGRADRAAVTVKPPSEDVEHLLRRPFVRRARYVGRFGWLTVEMSDDESLGLALELIDRSYLLAARGAPRGG
jgi:predicted DNA-binding protein (MmcQ/YjbR family)